MILSAQRKGGLLMKSPFPAGGAVNANAPVYIVSARIGVDGDALILRLNRVVTVTQQGGFALTMTGGVVTIGNSAGTGTKILTFPLTGRVVTDFESGTLAFAPPPGVIVDSEANALAAFSGRVVRNGSRVDGTPPLKVSITVGVTGETTSIRLTEAVTEGVDGHADFALTFSGGDVGLSYVSGLGTNTLLYENDRVVYQEETGGLMDFTQLGDGIQDLAGNLLASFADAVVVNGSAAPTPDGPTNTVLPAITGTQEVGETLTCSAGTWTGSPTITYQWKRDGVNISGETASTYEIEAVAGGLSCYVTGTNGGGAVTVRADSGLARPFYWASDSTGAFAWVTPALQAAFDARFGAGKVEVTNSSESSANLDRVREIVEEQILPFLQIGWAVVGLMEIANDISGVQGTHTGAETTTRMFDLADDIATAGGIPLLGTAWYRPGGTYNGTQAQIVCDNVRTLHQDHSSPGFIELDLDPIYDDCEAFDGVHETEAVDDEYVGAIVDGFEDAGLVGGCGDILIQPVVLDNLYPFLSSAPGTGNGYIYDPVSNLPATDLTGQAFVVKTNTGGWIRGPFYVDAAGFDFTTPHGTQKIIHGVPSLGDSTAPTPAEYVPPYATSGRHEVSNIVFGADTGGNMNGSTFRIADADGTVDVYLDSGGATPPVGADRTIQVTYSNGDAGSVIGTAVIAAMNSDGAWWANARGTGGDYCMAADAVSGARAHVTSSSFGITATTLVNGN
jgi:hypothetical protein